MNAALDECRRILRTRVRGWDPSREKGALDACFALLCARRPALDILEDVCTRAARGNNGPGWVTNALRLEAELPTHARTARTG